MAQWSWRLQADTLGSNPAVACFFLFSPFSLIRLSSNETSILSQSIINMTLIILFISNDILC